MHTCLYKNSCFQSIYSFLDVILSQPEITYTSELCSLTKVIVTFYGKYAMFLWLSSFKSSVSLISRLPKTRRKLL